MKTSTGKQRAAIMVPHKFHSRYGVKLGEQNYVSPVKLHYPVNTNTCTELQQQRPLPGRQGSCRGSSSTGPSSQARNTQTWASPQYRQRSGSRF